MTIDTKEQESKKARARVSQYHLLLSRRNHFDLLGVGREATPEQVRESFKVLAKQWHADAFAGVDLGDDKRKLDEIFQSLNEAYETLTDETRRAEYLVFLDRSAKGLATDVNSILRAEALVDEALMDIRRRQWNDAQAKLDEAKTLNPDDPLYDVHLAWVEYHHRAKDGSHVAKAVDRLRMALKRQQNIALAYQYLGQIHFDEKKYPDAKKFWKVCLQYDPRNVDVQRGIRLINTRAQKKSDSGIWAFLNKLLGKK